MDHEDVLIYSVIMALIVGVVIGAASVDFDSVPLFEDTADAVCVELYGVGWVNEEKSFLTEMDFVCVKNPENSHTVRTIQRDKVAK